MEMGTQTREMSENVQHRQLAWPEKFSDPDLSPGEEQYFLLYIPNELNWMKVITIKVKAHQIALMDEWT